MMSFLCVHIVAGFFFRIFYLSLFFFCRRQALYWLISLYVANVCRMGKSQERCVGNVRRRGTHARV